MFPRDLFRHCPSCAGKLPPPRAGNHLACESCGFLYYFNPAIAVAGFVFTPDGRGLFIRRAKEPGKGMLAVPGGFVEFDETAEQALRREAREEVNLDLAELQFLCTQTNSYNYGGVTYRVLDLFFVARAVDGAQAAALDGVESFDWVDPRAVSLESIAFPSIRNALVLLRERWPADAPWCHPS
jgi:ADP-ribose pyrophosphatase YjhB (NUDIX family)